VPRVTISQTNFAFGELSPRMFGRTDIPAYPNAADTLENVIVTLQGGVRSRDGTLYVANAKSGTNSTRLIPFVSDSGNAFILELGDLYMRFYKAGARIESPPGTPVEVVTPYASSTVFALNYCQGSDTMIFTHPTLPPQRLRRFSDTLWVFDAIPIDPQPFAEIGDSFATVVTLSLATVGAGRTATAAAATWQNSDVGRFITYQGGYATITGFTSSTIVTVTIVTAFQSVTLPASVWTLGGTPQEGITPSGPAPPALDPIGTTITLTAAALNTWRSSDVGKYVSIAGGLVKITVFTSALVVSARIIEKLTSQTVLQPAKSWVLMATPWSTANGYPAVCCFYQQRLILAATTAQPQTVWGSSTGAYFDFTIGPYDNDAFAYTLASDQINPILALSASSILVAFTYGGEFTVKGGVEKPITPTNVQVDNQTNYGAAAVRPVRVGKEIAYVQRSGLKLRALAYDLNFGTYDAPDLTYYSEHISNKGDGSAYGLTELAFAQEPESTLYCKRADGVLATLTYSAQAQVQAWCRQVISGGVVLSVASIPVAGKDQVWILVRRTINAVVTQHIEYFDSSVCTDCTVSLSNFPTALTTWTGLGYLEGKTVSAYVLSSDGSGTDFGDFTVTGGQITLSHAVNIVKIGLPSTSTVKELTPEIQTGTGTAAGNAMRTSEISVRMKSTASLIANGKDQITPKAFGANLLDDPTPAFTGVKRLELLGWDRGSSDLTLTRTRPFPFHILSVIRKFTVND
jgi:hypothetical protein